MYNPIGRDNNKEFIEIKNTINLTGFIISDSSSNDTLVPLQFVDSIYALIVEEGFDYSDLNCSIYSAGSTIGNGLSNSGDILRLYGNNNTLISIARYNSTLANGNGHSLEFINNSWQESQKLNGSPCLENSFVEITINVSENQIKNNITNKTENPRDYIEENSSIDQNNSINQNQTFNDSNFRGNNGNVGQNFTFDDSKKNVNNNDTNNTIQNETEESLIENSQPTETSDIETDNTHTKNCFNEPNSHYSIIKTSKKIEYSVLKNHDSVEQNKTFKTVIKIVNNDDFEHRFTIWSYIYRGSKSYPRNRTANQIFVSLSSKSEKAITLTNTASAPVGSYRFKIRIKKDFLKTNYEITKNIKVINNRHTETIIKDLGIKKGESDEIKVIKNNTNKIQTSKIAKNETIETINDNLKFKFTSNKSPILPLKNTTSRKIYESSKLKSKNILKHIILSSIGVLLSIFIWKKPI
ncbi:hypothetical protein DRJ17_03300 [Candidatus Woesearchaeota archaeon]|nr:MAG: hypothetical protein DRJ17_03300 [Candidatus Woesearchaeota archaeon]